MCTALDNKHNLSGNPKKIKKNLCTFFKVSDHYAEDGGYIKRLDQRESKLG